MGKRKARVWTKDLWSVVNVGERAFANAPLGGFWESLTRGLPLLNETRTTFDMNSLEAKPVRVRVTIREIVPKRRKGVKHGK